MKKFIAIAWIFILFFTSANAQDVTLSGSPCGGGTVSGTWVVPCHVTSINIAVYGSGGGAGGGGGGSNGGLFNTRGGGGAGGGGYTTIIINVVPGSSFSYSIGAGGCGGSGGSDGSSGNNGTTGGNSTFTGTDAGGTPVNLAANGGVRGTPGSGTGGSTGSGGAGGSASGGTTNTTGGAGNNGSGGSGGSGGAGAGPLGGAGGVGNGVAGNIYGGGGAGGGDSPGGNGAAGGILITYNTTIALPAVPTISSTPPTCIADGTSTISNYDGATTYVFTPAGPVASAGGVISGMVTGTSYTVVAGTGSCASAPSASFSNAASTGPPTVPAITTTPPTCTADGVSTISNYNAAMTYLFTPAGPTAGAGGVISGMVTGTSYTVVASDGSCSSASSASFSNGAQLPVPAVPTTSTTPPTCIADGSSTISNYNAALTYVFTPAGPTVAVGGAISGMVTGTSYTVEASDGTCNSAPSSSFSNGAATPPPAVPTIATTPPTCSADGSSTISNYNAVVIYIFTPAGPSASAGGVISGMVTGTNYTLEASDGSCTSSPSASFSNNAQLPVPAVPTTSTTPPTCIADGSSTISNYNAALTYVFTPAGPSVAVGGAISGMVTGTSYTVEASDGTCTSAPSTSFSNAAQTVPPAVPAISTTPPTCTADGSSIISNYDVAMTYIFTPTGPSASAGGVITGMASGTSYTVEASDGSCLSGPSASFSNAAQLPTPDATITGSLTYCTGGNTTLTAPSGATSYAWTDAGGNNIGSSASVTVTQGTYTVSVTNSDNCTASASAIVTELLSLSVAINGTLSYCPGSNTTLTATGGTSYTWSNGNATDNTTVTQGTYSVTATDAGCTGTASAVVTEIAVAPLNLGSDVSACDDSSIVIDAGSGYTSYVWASGETTQAILPQISGAYSVTAVDANNCSVSDAVNVVFNSCQEYNVFIPNAFTPNGDGNNDVFQYYLPGVTFAEVQVFNRWGEKVFETNNASEYWNGTNKGEQCSTGVFVYDIKLLSSKGRADKYKGSITLIR